MGHPIYLLSKAIKNITLNQNHFDKIFHVVPSVNPEPWENLVVLKENQYKSCIPINLRLVSKKHHCFIPTIELLYALNVTLTTFKILLVIKHYVLTSEKMDLKNGQDMQNLIKTDTHKFIGRWTFNKCIGQPGIIF